MNIIDTANPEIKQALCTMITTIAIYPMHRTGEPLNKDAGRECEVGPIFDSFGLSFERFFRPRSTGTEIRTAVWSEEDRVWMEYPD